MAGNIKKSERSYVAFSAYEQDAYTHKMDWFVLYAGDKGESKEDVEQMALMCAQERFEGIILDTVQKNLFVVTERAAKRSYKAAWDFFVESWEAVAAEEEAYKAENAEALKIWGDAAKAAGEQMRARR